jgi:hypothetical protein
LSKIKSKINPSSIPHNTSGSPRTLGAAMDIFWNNIPFPISNLKKDQS